MHAEGMRFVTFRHDGTSGDFARRGATGQLQVADVDGDRDLELLVSNEEDIYAYDLPGAAHDRAVEWGVEGVGNPDHTRAYRRPNEAPRLDPIGPQQVVEGAPMELAVRASDADADPLTMQARLAAGGPVSAIGAAFRDHGDGTGTFTWTPGFDVVRPPDARRDVAVIFEVFDGTDRASVLATIIVGNTNRAPNAMAVASPLQGRVPLTVRFDGLGSRDPDDDDPLRFEWRFGDGTTGEGAVVEHTYAEPGAYSVTLLVSDGQRVGSAAFVVTADPAVFSVTLHRLLLRGERLAITYSKNFGTCAHLRAPQGEAIHRQNFLCELGERITVERPVADFTVPLAPGQLLTLCHGNRPGECSPPVAVEREGEPFPGCPRDGDVNRDGRVTPADALLAHRHLLGQIVLTACEQDHADATRNGLVEGNDVQCIFDHFLGRPSCLREPLQPGLLPPDRLMLASRS